MERHLRVVFLWAEKSEEKNKSVKRGKEIRRFEKIQNEILLKD